MVSVDKVRGLIKLFEQSDASELQIRYITGGKVTITNSSKSNSNIFNQRTKKKNLEVVQETLIPEPKIEKIVSPKIGTFYWNEQKEDYHPLVEGEKVVKGQVVGYVEAMNFMDVIKSDYDGIVKKINVKHGSLVDLDSNRPLFEIELK